MCLEQLWYQEMRLEKRPQSPPTAERLWDLQETPGIHAALREVKGEGEGISADSSCRSLSRLRCLSLSSSH